MDTSQELLKQLLILSTDKGNAECEDDDLKFLLLAVNTPKDRIEEQELFDTFEAACAAATVKADDLWASNPINNNKPRPQEYRWRPVDINHPLGQSAMYYLVFTTGHAPYYLVTTKSTLKRMTIRNN